MHEVCNHCLSQGCRNATHLTHSSKEVRTNYLLLGVAGKIGVCSHKHDGLALLAYGSMGFFVGADVLELDAGYVGSDGSGRGGGGDARSFTRTRPRRPLWLFWGYQ